MVAAAEERAARGGRPPTAPCHGPGRRAGGRQGLGDVTSTAAALRSQGSTRDLLATASMGKVWWSVMYVYVLVRNKEGCIILVVFENIYGC